MTGPEHYRKAEELAAEAHKHLGQGEGQAAAAVWAAVAQVHAALALAAATAIGTAGADRQAWAAVAETRPPVFPPSSREGLEPRPGRTGPPRHIDPPL
jgi:hypothetical protein